MVTVINSLSPKRKVSLIGLLILVFFAFASGAIWLVMPNYSVLFQNLDGVTAAEAINRLEEQQIPFKVSETSSGNVISVPSDQAEQLKVTMTADLGLPDVKGLELFDNADYSMTDFSQDVTYQRALQGELARTISSMPGIVSTRVHITFAPKRLFSAEQQDAKASIFIEQIPEVTLSEAQIAGIQKLTANAVERLDASNVSVFGENGAELSLSGDSTVNNQIDKRYQAKYLMEQKLMEKAYRLLSLAISPEKIAVSVDVTLNFDQRKRMKQGYAANADGQGAISKQRESSIANEETNRQLKNEPILSREKETEYLHGQETEETIYSSGEVSKIAVGVALRENLTEKQIKQIKDVLAAGLGINKFRGDMLAVEVINIEPIVNAPVITVPTESSILPQDINEKGQEIVKDTSSVKTNHDWFSTLSPWWFFGLLLIPIPILIFRQRSLSIKKREDLLLEVKNWLQTEEQARV
jgi:flagellar M-ring protein FliF